MGAGILLGVELLFENQPMTDVMDITHVWGSVSCICIITLGIKILSGYNFTVHLFVYVCVLLHYFD